MPARIPEPLARRIVKQPNLLLGKHESIKYLSSAEQSILQKPLRPAPKSVSALGPWLGRLGEAVSKPECIVHGVCQGRLPNEKRLWLDLGPSIETVYGLDLAYEVARQFSAELIVWIVDNEYALYASSTAGCPETELEIGAALEKFVRERYDYEHVRVRRTSDDDTRGEVYSLVTQRDVQQIVQDRVYRPFGLSGSSIWLQLEFLCTMASLVMPAVRGRKTWAVIDHHQLRPAAVANRLSNSSLDTLVFWPLPGLDWRPDNLRSKQHFSTKGLSARRMYASDTLSGKAFLLDDEQTLMARNCFGDNCSVDEVTDYLKDGCDPASQLEADSLWAAITARRHRYASLN